VLPINYCYLCFGRLDCTSVCANNRKHSLILKLSWEKLSMRFSSYKAPG